MALQPIVVEVSGLKPKSTKLIGTIWKNHCLGTINGGTKYCTNLLNILRLVSWSCVSLGQEVNFSTLDKYNILSAAPE